MGKSLPHYKSQSGNVLIYILGAIFLLGILVIAVKGSSTPGAGIDPEQLMIRVAEVQEYGKELERAVAYVLANGHSESDIRFAHPNADSAYGDITDTPTRQVFSREGGGARYRDPPDGIQTTATPWHFSGNNVVGQIGSGVGATNSNVDLTAILTNVSEDFCTLVNEKNDALSTTGDIPQDCGNVEISNPFNGSYTFVNQILDGSGCGETELLLSKMEGCFEGDNDPPSGTYHYYRVLLVR